MQMANMSHMPVGNQQSQVRLPVKNTNVGQMTSGRLPAVISQPNIAQVFTRAEKPINMMLLREQSFAPMKEETLTNFLTSMKLPVTKENVTLARSMVEGGVPLTAQNHKELKEALSKLPLSRPTDTQAATFLKSSSMPLTPQNVTTMSNFLSSHPQIGAHFFEFSQEFRKLSTGKSGKISADRMAILEKAASKLGEMVMDGNSMPRSKNAKAFREMGRQVGLDFPRFMGKQDDDELSQLMTLLRQMLYGKEGDDSLEKMRRVFSKTEETFLAQQLINKGRREGQENFYYLQIPVRLEGQELTAEMKLYYTTDYQGRKVVDGNNFEFELVVPSCNIGDSYFHVKVENGIINFDVGMENTVYCDFMAGCIPVLVERVEQLGYFPGNTSVYVIAGKGENLKPVETTQLEAMESVDMCY